MKILGSDFDGTLSHGGIGEEKLSAMRKILAERGRTEADLPALIRNPAEELRPEK